MKKENKSPSSGMKQFGNYLIGKALGQGTFGKVKLGIHKSTKQNVAIKLLQKNRISDNADTERVLRQIHILKLVRHPNIVQLYEIIQTNKKLLLVMEYMENGQLFEYIVKHKRLSQEQACRLFHQLIDGIQHIHKIGVVHRDLKPENLLLDYQNNLRIVDFGLSNTYKKNQRLKTACGSPCYAAPEMLKGQAYDGLGVDIWSAGVILFAMVVGYLPFQDNQNQAELYRKIMQGEYNITVNISDNVKDLIRRILTVDPLHRYTIDQIRKHQWMTMNCSHRRSSRGIVIGYNRIPIDTKVLNSLEDMGLDVEKTQSSLEANRHNNLTTTYYLALKKYIKEGGETNCDLASKDFDKSLLQPIGLNNRRDGAKTNQVLIENFFTGNTTESNTNIRKKSKDKIRQKQKLEKSKQKQKQNREPNHQKIDKHQKQKQKQKQKQNNQNEKSSSMFPIKKSRTNSRVTRIDPKIDCSINYGRPSTTKSNQKIIKRESQFQNRLNRRYKQKFNQSLISKSKDRIIQSTKQPHHQQMFHQPHLRSKMEAPITGKTNRNQTYEVTEIMQDIQGKQKRANSKKTCGQSIKSDMLKVAKARWI